MKRYGTQYGGYYLPEPLPLNCESIIYSFGAGEDISFDVELAHASGAKVHIFDFTPRALKHVYDVKDHYEGKSYLQPNKRYGGGDPGYLSRLVINRVESSQIEVHPWGLYTEDCSLPFFFPHNPEHVSLSAKPEGKSGKVLVAPVKTLETTMLELKHDHIDVLKMDIECVELEVLDQMLKSDIRPRFLAVDFDSARTLHHRQSLKCVEMLHKLQEAGYKMINFDNWDCSFSYCKQMDFDPSRIVAQFQTPNGEFVIQMSAVDKNPLQVKYILRILRLTQENIFKLVGLFPLK